MPEASATSSIEVPSKPALANAAAAPRRIDSWRCSRVRSLRGLRVAFCIRVSIQFEAVTEQLEYTESELLENHDFAEPLIAGGVRCHGGFDDDGVYVSPRTKRRVPAIEAWQAQHA